MTHPEQFLVHRERHARFVEHVLLPLVAAFVLGWMAATGLTERETSVLMAARDEREAALIDEVRAAQRVANVAVATALSLVDQAAGQPGHEAVADCSLQLLRASGAAGVARQVQP